MSDAELLDPHHVTVGFVGQPGQRVFYLQVEDEHARVTLVLEKGQVAGIARLLRQLLARLDDVPATDWDRDAMALRAPVDEDWRVGEIALGLDTAEERFLLELTEVERGGEEPAQLRVAVDRDQARRLAAHAEEQIEQGRPTCRLCGRPEDPDGDHVCPATNGHGELSR